MYICVRPFFILNGWDWSWTSKKCEPHRIAQYDSLREELLVLKAWAFFCWLLLFVGIEKNGLTEHSRIATTISNHSHPPSQPRASLLTQLRRGGRRQSGTRRRSGWGLLSQWMSEISMRRSGRENQKDEEGDGWLVLFSTHSFHPCTFSILVVSACLLHGAQMVNSH